MYQHDTPDKYLFEKTVRAYSHGCMRVENPDQYAEVLLSISQPEDRYSARRIRSLYGAGEHNINLKNPIPVYLTYQTTFVNDAGQLQTRPDIYGLDQIISELLKRDRAVADIPVARSYGSGSKPVVARVWSRPRYEVVQQPAGWGPPGRQIIPRVGRTPTVNFIKTKGIIIRPDRTSTDSLIEADEIISRADRAPTGNMIVGDEPGSFRITTVASNEMVGTTGSRRAMKLGYAGPPTHARRHASCEKHSKSAVDRVENRFLEESHAKTRGLQRAHGITRRASY